MKMDILLIILSEILLYVLTGTNGRHVQAVCGWNFQYYDPLTHVCINEHVYVRSSTSAVTTPYSSNVSRTSAQEQNPDRLPRRICRSHEDLLDCNGKLHCGGTVGYRCCGFDVFHPRNQTCCQQTSVQYRIHDKPEKKHMCCQLDVYKRGYTNTTCLHPGANDRFFKRPSKLVKDQRICTEANYVFRIRVTRQRKRRSLTATVGVWAWSPLRAGGRTRMKKHPAREVDMDIKLDRYSPKKNLAKKTFLIFSRHQYMKNAVFFLRPDDDIYRSPKRHRKLVQKLKKIVDKCNK